MEYLSSEIAFCLCKSAIWPCIEYGYHVQAVAHGCYLDILNTQQKRLCRNVGPTLAACLEHLIHRRNVTSFTLF